MLRLLTHTVAVGALSGNKVVAKGVIIISESEDLPVAVMALSLIRDNVPGTVLLNLSKIGVIKLALSIVLLAHRHMHKLS